VAGNVLAKIARMFSNADASLNSVESFDRACGTRAQFCPLVNFDYQPLKQLVDKSPKAAERK